MSEEASQTEGSIAIPDLTGRLFSTATADLHAIHLEIKVAPSPDGSTVDGEISDEARVERNASGSDAGMMVNAGTIVGVILFPFEGRQ